ncbi:MAG: hypothetical protein KA020_18255 [Planctomycetes bacterium]|nr:hypothetical protein [Planctomycetota bacterium]MCC7065735.1 hypothetical protein [Planctomycetota bacterium]
MNPKNPTWSARHPLTDDEGGGDDLFYSCASCGCSSCRSDLEDGDASRAPHRLPRRFAQWRSDSALRPSQRPGH